MHLQVHMMHYQCQNQKESLSDNHSICVTVKSCETSFMGGVIFYSLSRHLHLTRTYDLNVASLFIKH